MNENIRNDIFTTPRKMTFLIKILSDVNFFVAIVQWFEVSYVMTAFQKVINRENRENAFDSFDFGVEI